MLEAPQHDRALLFYSVFVFSIFRLLPTRWRRNPAGIDTERNYVTVTLCIAVTRWSAVAGRELTIRAVCLAALLPHH